MNTTKSFGLLALAMGLALSGCKTTTGATSYAAFADMTADMTSVTPTPLANMPAGSATYNGFANIGLDGGVGATSAALGQVALNVDFASSAVSGAINNFIYFDETAASGSMTISNGVIAGNEFTADADGTVGGNLLDYALDGDFLGDNAEMIALYFNGTSTSGGGVPVTVVGVGVAAD